LPHIGSNTTCLIIIRGNSASGKTSVAWRIRERYGRGLAIVSQDVLRRDILRVKDEPVNPAIGLIELTARYALDHGFHVIVEGILGGASHGEMLTALVRDHAGRSACFYYDLDLDETVNRHASKPQVVEYGADLMREWYRGHDLVPALNETILGPEISLDAAASMMMQAVGLASQS
jgi:hypothetical protein